MTTLNGLPSTWDSFIQEICAKKKLVKFSRLWEQYSQKENRIVARKENMGNEDQAILVQSNKRKTNHHQGKHFHPRRSNKNIPKFRCFICGEIGHYARYFPKKKNGPHKKKGNKKINHAHAAEDDEPSKKRIKQDSDDYSSDENMF